MSKEREKVATDGRNDVRALKILSEALVGKLNRPEDYYEDALYMTNDNWTAARGRPIYFYAYELAQKIINDSEPQIYEELNGVRLEHLESNFNYGSLIIDAFKQKEAPFDALVNSLQIELNGSIKHVDQECAKALLKCLYQYKGCRSSINATIKVLYSMNQFLSKAELVLAIKTFLLDQ